jgi:hypothetical protein
MGQEYTPASMPSNAALAIFDLISISKKFNTRGEAASRLALRILISAIQ